VDGADVCDFPVEGFDFALGCALRAAF